MKIRVANFLSPRAAAVVGDPGVAVADICGSEFGDFVAGGFVV